MTVLIYHRDPRCLRGSGQPTSPLQTRRTEFLVSKKDKGKRRASEKAGIPNKQIPDYPDLPFKAVTKTESQLQFPHCTTIHTARYHFKKPHKQTSYLSTTNSIISTRWREKKIFTVFFSISKGLNRSALFFYPPYLKRSIPGEILNSLHHAELIKYVCLCLFFFICTSHFTMPQSISICPEFPCDYSTRMFAQPDLLL